MAVTRDERVVHKQSRSGPVMRAVLEAVADRLRHGDESLLRIPEVCAATGVNYGSVYHHFGSREGVIDAAYEMMFGQIIDDDIEMIHDAIEGSDNLEDFLTAAARIFTAVSTGDERRVSRSMRLRIVAASVTRPHLRSMIGATQARLTDELALAVLTCQERGWVRRNLDPRAFAVYLQVVVFGRNLDDASDEPLAEDVWVRLVFDLFCRATSDA
ncbi:MAG TPA: TetR/AcrR family transcriptional regulator [Acidimicrobiales bacterium]|nr:TetR/AcrR family transcriptional regulator [Acidimicrobiales bacterium]